MRAISRLAPHVRRRSGGRCEALWSTSRCVNPAEQIHHRMPRSRASFQGDHLLDTYGVIHHLADLCEPCHTRTHRSPVAARVAGTWDGREGLTVPGSVVREWTGDLRYVGDHYQFSHIYPGIQR